MAVDSGMGNEAGRRWPAWMALLTAPWLPKTTAERTNHVSLWRAWAVHFACFVAALLLVFFLVAWRQVPAGAGLKDIRAEMVSDLRDVSDEPDLLIVGAAIQLAFALLAALIPLWLLGYVWLLARAARGFRYANR